MSKYNGNREFKINIPGSVKLIIDVLENNGYEAFAVGGCVRDTILDREPQDWDITTSALPEQVKELFNRTLDTGIQHGTVTVMIGKDSYEVTTYRIDGAYEDMKQYLSKKAKLPTAFFSDNDMIALGAMKAMAEFGIRIPEDVSIVGFDDLTFSSISYPPLTTLRVPKQEMGRAVVRRLRDMLKDNDGIKLKMQMCTQFIERESVKKI